MNRLILLSVLILLSFQSCFAFLQTPSSNHFVKQNQILPQSFPQPLLTTMVMSSSLRDIEAQVKDQLLKVSEPGTTARQFAEIFIDFLDQYTGCCEVAGMDAQQYGYLTSSFLKLVDESFKSPHQFDLYHKAIREPFDYYSWGNDFFRPLIINEESKVFGIENLEKIKSYIDAGENVVLYSNHQTEADPQVISLLLEPLGYTDLAEKIICVAGHRVTTDPLAIPYSMGRNLLTIYSKKHMDNPPEEKASKQERNMKTLKKAGEELGKGGTLLWVAPSGGRDRPAPGTKDFVIAPMDPKSVDLFKIMAKGIEKQAKTHFFPLAMFTNGLVPPPDELKTTLGEPRSASRSGVSLAFGDEVMVDEIKGKGKLGGFVEAEVNKEYAKLKEFHASH